MKKITCLTALLSGLLLSVSFAQAMERETVAPDAIVSAHEERILEILQDDGQFAARKVKVLVANAQLVTQKPAIPAAKAVNPKGGCQTWLDATSPSFYDQQVWWGTTCDEQEIRQKVAEGPILWSRTGYYRSVFSPTSRFIASCEVMEGHWLIQNGRVPTLAPSGTTKMLCDAAKG